MEPITLKLYSPLTAHLIDGEYEEDGLNEYEGLPLTGDDLVSCESIIREAIEQETLPEEGERGLMAYYGLAWEDGCSLEQKVLSAFPDVEVYNGELWGVLRCTLQEPLNAYELEQLREYWSGQMSDGWGEGFEQRPRHTEWGDLYVHFWHDEDDFFVSTEQELKGLAEQTRNPPAKQRNHMQQER